MLNWLRELLKIEIPEHRCIGCEILQEQLNKSDYDRKVLLETLVRKCLPQEEARVEQVTEGLAPIRVGKQAKPWRVRQAELEADSRKRAQELVGMKIDPGMKEKSVEELEQELGVSTDGLGINVPQGQES